MLAALEDEMCMWTPQSDAKSPNRLDALVWAITELVIDPEPIGVRLQLGEGYQISQI
jgi:phage terminase large subunit-like protein